MLDPSARLPRKKNTIINICGQNEEMIIERFGKFHRKQKPGVFACVPLIDRIPYRVDMRELTIPVHPQSAITKDNVSVELGGNIYIQFVDSYKAAYGAYQPIYAVSQHAQSAMRAIVGDTTLDELFHRRNEMNTYILQSLEAAAEAWGIKVHRYEITTVHTDPKIHDAMNKQAAAERQRREDVLHAEATKRTLILESEGKKEKLINESEGHKIETINKASADAEALRLSADAHRYQQEQEANGKAAALLEIGKALATEDGQHASRFTIAQKYLEEYGKIVNGSNTVVLPSNCDNVVDMVTKGMTMYDALKGTTGRT
eukprot:TRINITY_DN642_c0_g1_i2.p1 TRINITY_DN642_c0_g1~~TRINITY_DN642_c0_g1_i2.p1  ORF type:complete len:353 (+),score=48.74 TRINITY_DN642_c0_g1_i2:114-1061(+)